MKKTPDFLRVIPGGLTDTPLPDVAKDLTIAQALSWTNYSAAIAEINRNQIIKRLEAREAAVSGVRLG
jgi:hypothetical protein